ncbi:MAG: hypothetical protein ACFFDW_16165 [Candidatus Thorarchaeota archaeon]
MFSKNKGKDSLPKNHQIIHLLITESEAAKIGLLISANSSVIILDNKQAEQLITKLEEQTKKSDLLVKFSKELETTQIRTIRLQETKNVVYSLRETDNTSDTALNFLQEKLTLLQQEKEDHEFHILTAQERLAKITENSDLIEFLSSFIQNYIFLETDSWEEELDYFRMRFLLQREQEEEDQKLKEEYLPTENSNTEFLDSYSKQDLSIAEKDYIKIYVHKKYFTKLKELAKKHNQAQMIIQQYPTFALQEKSLEELQELVTEQESKSFTIGKELYSLKREQGILTLKTYEIVQTLKSRLLNITGSIASRRFIKDSFTDLNSIIENSNLSVAEKKVQLQNGLARLLRITRKEPSEGK